MTAIFDMDNVLFPTEGLKFLAYQRAFADVCGAAIADTPDRVGLSERVVAGLYLRKIGAEASDERVAEIVAAKRAAYYSILEEEDFTPYRGVGALLEELSGNGWKTGLATLSDRKSTDSLLARFGFSRLFDSVLTVEDVSRPKPDPEIYTKSAARLGADAVLCIAIEDSPAGVEAAKRAGMKVVAVTHSVARAELSAADAVADDFDEVALALAAFDTAAANCQTSGTK